MDRSDALAALGALAQPMRLDAFRLLVQAGEAGLPAGGIAARLGVRQNTLSANLAVLLNAGLVRQRREGRVVRYFAEIAAMRGLLTFLMEDCCGGDPALCRPLLDDIAGPRPACGSETRHDR